jgi:hypothetical protein
MRKFFLLLTLVLIALLAVYRNRVFLRDPLGKVERNGVAVGGAQVYINYSNDVLVMETAAHTMFAVQNWNRTPGTPTELKCIQMLMCVTVADHAVTPENATGDGLATMSNREVSFTDAASSHVRVQIR